MVIGRVADALEALKNLGGSDIGSSVAELGQEKVRDAISAVLKDLNAMYDIIDEVAPLPGEAVLYKTAPSAFFGTPLVSHFVKEGVDTVIVAGETTSGCVRATVVDGCSYRYRMIVAEECVFDRDEAPHAINLFDMHEKYADVLPLADVLREIEAYAERTQGRVAAAG